MKHWFRDAHFRTLMKNSSYLGMSRGVAAVCSLATLAFTGRQLGLEQFGLLVLIASYTQAASGLSRFQSWLIPVRYGARVVHGEDVEGFRDGTNFALALDFTSGIAGMGASIALLPLLAHWFGLPPERTRDAMLYCLLLPTMAGSTPNGILRALDRFDLISWSLTVTPITRTALTFAGWILGWQIEAWLAIWFFTDLAGDLYIWFLAWREMRRKGLTKGIRPSFDTSRLANAWPFAIKINLTASLSSAWGPIARLIVGGLLGPSSAALYRVAAVLADSTQKPADLLGRAYYPQVARMDLTTKQPWKLMRRGMIAAGIFAGAAILMMLIGGKPLLGAAFGQEFIGAYPPLLALLVVPAMTIIAFPLSPMLYALHREDAPLKARIVGTLAYFGCIRPMVHAFGLVGAALAYVLAHVILYAVQGLILRREFRRVRMQ
ncbi:MAG: lipopolysaccharide biosynthesis protein [Sphingomicrobium sp.]